VINTEAMFWEVARIKEERGGKTQEEKDDLVVRKSSPGTWQARKVGKSSAGRIGGRACIGGLIWALKKAGC
jgi:hypothetical protein